jgi:DNA-binding MarR family transcriptional regulator
MVETQTKRVMAAYPAIYLACHREHARINEEGNTLTENQASVLNHLEATPPTTLSKLAEHMGVGRSTMSTTVARLVRGGYIARRQNHADRRSVELTLTASGKRIQEQNTVLNPLLIGQLLRMMKPDEAELAVAGLERLAQAAAILLKRRKRERDG